MQKKLVRQSLALSAAAALSLSGAFIAGPAMADAPKQLEVQSESDMQDAVAEYLTDDHGELPKEIGRFGFNKGDLYLGVTKKTAEVEELEKKFHNVKIEVGPQYRSFDAQAAKDLVGGAGYVMEIPNDEVNVGLCSVGFSGWNSSGDQVLVTAGHCAESLDEDGNSTGESPIKDLELPSAAQAVTGEKGTALAGTGAPGTWDFHQFGLKSDEAPTTPDEEKEAIDFATVKVAEGFTSQGKVSDWSHAEQDDLLTGATPVTQMGDPEVGSSIKKSGRTTGLTSGTVATGVDDEMPYAAVSGRVVHGFEVKGDSGAFSDHGDSGGAVFQGDTAVGVISGGDEAGTMTWVADLKNSLAKSGQDFQLTKPDDGGDDANNDAKADDGADGNDAKADDGADGNDAKADDGADGSDTKADDGADGSEADADAKDGGSDTAADGKDADSDGSDDGDEPEKPEAPKVGDQKVDESGQITGKAAPNADVKLSWKAAGEAQAGSAQAQADVPAEGSVTVKADANGNFKAEAPAEAGEYAYTATATVEGQTSAATSFVVTVEAADEAPAERKLTIDPKEIAASDFVKKDKGVQIKAEGFDEGEKVTLKVANGPKNVKDITLEETANENGVAGFSIYGTSASNPSAYLGKYDLEVTGANDTDSEKALNGSFEVVADEDGNGGGNGGDDNGNDDGNGDGGSDLPRTGAELTGLAAGAGLLVVGGAAVVLTMRRKKNN